MTIRSKGTAPPGYRTRPRTLNYLSKIVFSINIMRRAVKDRRTAAWAALGFFQPQRPAYDHSLIRIAHDHQLTPLAQLF